MDTEVLKKRAEELKQKRLKVFPKLDKLYEEVELWGGDHGYMDGNDELFEEWSQFEELVRHKRHLEGSYIGGPGGLNISWEDMMKSIFVFNPKYEITKIFYREFIEIVRQLP